MSLHLILGDQLDSQISCLKDFSKDQDTVLMCEVIEEATYVKHHPKKIALIFSAMRHFAQDLQKKGFSVRYVKLDDPKNTGSFKGEVQRALKDLKLKSVVCTSPGEYRVLQSMKSWAQEFSASVEIRKDDRFLCSHEEFKYWSQNRKELRMEFFYRDMRKKHKILMEGKKPVGGKWNYDIQNRKAPPKDLDIPKSYFVKADKITEEVLDLVENKFSNHFGKLRPFQYAVTRQQALKALKLFIQERLPLFGTYQDAMLENKPWMYHSHLSFYLNCGLLRPLECIKAAEEAYYKEKAPLHSVEGFIRQILGWREYVRGIYWLKMPDYKKENQLKAQKSLPDFFWTGDTSLNCLKQCILETQENAYAHHIQRLMVLGNFSLLCGLHPDEVNEWYLIVYADAFEWVELPNVTGMILHADNGLLGSKPYASSGAYINKMSDYCKNCSFDVKLKSGPKACPFNYLYWNFLEKHKERFQKNMRMKMIYSVLKKMPQERLSEIKKDSQKFLKSLN